MADAPRPAPSWLVAFMLVASALMVVLLIAVNSEDAALSGSTTGTQRAGGREVSSDRGPVQCRDAPVEIEVAGRRYAGSDLVRGECLSSGETRTVEVRYDPDDPGTFATAGRQWVVPGLIALAALGFTACVVAVLRRAWARVRPPPPGSTRPARRPRSRTRRTLTALAVAVVLVLVAWVGALVVGDLPPGRAERQRMANEHYLEEVEIVETGDGELVRVDGRPRSDCTTTESGYLECSQEPGPTLDVPPPVPAG